MKSIKINVTEEDIERGYLILGLTLNTGAEVQLPISECLVGDIITIPYPTKLNRCTREWS